MATMDNQLVRVCRDIDGWDIMVQETEQSVRTVMRSIMALDEQIAIAHENPDQEILESYEFAVMINNLQLERAALYNQWVDTNERLRQLRILPQLRIGLQEYLEAWHSIDLAMPARDILPTRFEVSTHDEIERTIYPQYIVPAVIFATQQMLIWQRLSHSRGFCAGAWYTSFLGLEWTRARVDANIVGCSPSLFTFMQSTVDEAVLEILNQIAEDDQLVDNLGIRDFIETVDGDKVVNISRSPLDLGLSSVFSYRKVRGGILRRPVPVLVTCYRPPCRLSLNEILAGLRGGIDVVRSIVQSPAVKTFGAMSKVLVVAVITRLFHRMLVAGTRFGYITTGEAYIFVEIPAVSPGCVSYSLCVPRRDVEADPVMGLHRTAVAQVLAFTLRAFRAEPLPAAWFQDAQRTLWRWRVNPDDIFDKIPPLKRKWRRNIEYAPAIWSPFLHQSPLEQRAERMVLPGYKRGSNGAVFRDLGYFRFLSGRFIQPADGSMDQEGEPMDENEDPSGQDGESSSQDEESSEVNGEPMGEDEESSSQDGESTNQDGESNDQDGESSEQDGEPMDQDGEPSNQDGEPIEPAEILIDYRPFCTPECLWGLERHRGPDPDCPNYRYHGRRHLRLDELLDGLQDQLEDDVANGNQANHKFLSRSGLYTVLLKVRLASHGYTLLLKGVIPSKVGHLFREADMYYNLMSLQGFCIPVNFGMIETQNEVTSHYFGGYNIFMVFGGFAKGVMPLFQCMAAGIDKQVIVDAAERTFRHIHGERVLQFDPEPQNMLYDARLDRVIIADFERAVYNELDGQHHLNPIVQIEGVHEGRPERRRIPDRCFGLERNYVRQRIEEFFERGY
ncbi:hypothetical protein MKX08_003377 [Trichoderma sp. CBMAI-0020]|nr:hypothetical protein MKX08_003377 [Trichoderma sp. CBMAI-0020]